MADQATLNNGRPMAPAAGMRRSMKGFTADLAELAELQMRLLLADTRQARSGITVSTLALIGGVIVALGCVPVALAALALVLMAAAELSAVGATLIALATGVIIAVSLLFYGWTRGRKSLGRFERSETEFKRNFQWLKTTLRQPS